MNRPQSRLSFFFTFSQVRINEICCLFCKSRCIEFSYQQIMIITVKCLRKFIQNASFHYVHVEFCAIFLPLLKCNNMHYNLPKTHTEIWKILYENMNRFYYRLVSHKIYLDQAEYLLGDNFLCQFYHPFMNRCSFYILHTRGNSRTY